jgi:GTP-sensing pleiotropic transcriptional regulator CodY
MDNIPDPEQLEEIRKELKKVFTCQICGMPKMHHRLFGYRCNVNPEHDKMEHEIRAKFFPGVSDESWNNGRK